MPRLHPRQRLIREALAVGLVGLSALGLAIWWTWSPSPRLTIVTSPADPSSPIAVATPPSAPGGPLWHPAADGPREQGPPAAPPAFRLITLSQRDGVWVALIDPGHGGAAERVRQGDHLAEWLVSVVHANGVDLINGEQRLNLRFTP